MPSNKSLGLMFPVRPFEERDRSALEAVYRECRSEATWPRSAQEPNFTRDTAGEAVLVAVGNNDEPEGFVSVWEADKFIHHLYVRRESRNKGIGQQLLNSLAARLPKPWTLKCVRANEVALAFYLDRGWLEVSSGVGEDGPYAVLENAETKLFVRPHVQPLRALLPVVVQGTAVRLLQGSDVERFHAYRSDAELAIYQGWSPMSIGSAREFIEKMALVSELRRGDWVQLGITEVASNALVGDVGLYLEPNESTVEIGFTLHRDAQGVGHATRALQASLSLTFAASAARTMRAITDARNSKCIRVLERAGFSQSEARQATFKGEPCTEFLYVFNRPAA